VSGKGLRRWDDGGEREGRESGEGCLNPYSCLTLRKSPKEVLISAQGAFMGEKIFTLVGWTQRIKIIFDQQEILEEGGKGKGATVQGRKQSHGERRVVKKGCETPKKNYRSS